MTAKDLARIEEELGLELPTAYKKFMRSYPKALLQVKQKLPRINEGPADLQLLNDADRLIDLNAMVQSSDAFDEYAEQYFIVGESGCGDYYAIDTDDDESPVYFWKHETGDFDEDEEKDSLTSFAADLLELTTFVNEILKQNDNNEGTETGTQPGGPKRGRGRKQGRI